MTLPEVGKDRRTWGYKLLEFLREIHNEDGTIKDEYLAIIRDGLANDTDLDDLILVVQNITQSFNDLADAVDLKASDADLTDHVADVANPHAVTATQVGLGNVNNTSDANKPVSTATQTALDLKATITALNLKADSTTVATHIADVANPHSVTKTQVGLANADNTSDANKPVSTATQTALDEINLRPVTTKTANYVATNTDYTIRVDATSAPVTITLPVTVVGKVFEVEKIDASVNDVIVEGDGTDVINIPGIGPELNATLSDQFSFLILKCTTINQWTWISAVGTIT